MSGNVIYVQDIDALRALTGMPDGQAVQMVDTGRAGLFRWDSSDLSTQVSSDAMMGIYVPPAGQNGSLGAWVREFSGPVAVGWFGAVGDGVADDSGAIQSAIGYVSSRGLRAVSFPAGVYVITTPLLLVNDVALVADDFHRVSSESTIIRKTISTESPVLAARSSESTHFGDGHDGVDHYPNCIIHCVLDTTSDGACQTQIKGIELDGTDVCEYGIYGYRLPQSSIKGNRISGVDFGILIWGYMYIAEIGENVVNGCRGGIGVDNSTSLDVYGNFVVTYSDWAYHLEGLRYSSIWGNAADAGAEGKTDSYAVAYHFRQMDGCSIHSNGAERLNGIFMRIRQTRGCTGSNNFILAHDITYTGPDIIAIYYLDFPLGSWKNNRAVVSAIATGSPTRYNLYVENTYGQNSYEWIGNTISNNDSGFSTDISTMPEGYGRVATSGGAYGRATDDIPSDITLYVQSSGDDANSGIGSYANAVTSAQQLINRLPNTLNNTVTIDIGNENITENVVIRGFGGGGRIVIRGDGTGSWTGSVTAKNNSIAVEIHGFDLTPAGSSPGHALLFENTRGLVHGVNYNTSATGSRGFISVTQGASVNTYGNTITTEHITMMRAASGGNLVVGDDDAAQIAIANSYQRLSGGYIVINSDPV